MKSVGKPDAGNPHVRFDERGWETGRRLGVSTRAQPRLYHPKQQVSRRRRGDQGDPCLRESRACLQHDLRHSVSCSFRALSFRAGFFLLIGMTGAIGSSFSIAPIEMVKGKRYRLPPMMAVIV
jgi:hypothetical protein